ncbi:flagellar basal body rod protein FlgC [Rhodospirillum rubrum]|uniref:Flagellar basal-body rod protein FlgC n=1 Tax=Rhodospirillum rubrum (strain ATCC 11170 / ATH 1.1.1 / DSM 467 / LMG 4362 / NCIMB 8255 / S1) TaxID=269796 RepID=Q2RQH3_RHORT|nr:flagellar basal body rod protein FlgC [Rhodospirillum rubrum]ABC23622.1 Flagellar basal-body rod protein FlgC [Rhodospirillum rubrum ATCC 11170]AEO49360.1 flagellar basal body rod protein FlgC [Rhodospirillum rubrum F11]QXG79583.1 flagellar basal body rod protein FlgC [Rhodospirillum rubrum]HCF18071.1 flagellar basal body rod protein FlgC [Rhodospirillum rubrum]
MDELKQTAAIATSGLKAQTERLRTIAQNMANADSMAERQGEDPYRRRVVTFKSVMDREVGAEMVRTGRVREDMSAFTRKYDPSHPGADAEGYVLAPNVNPMVEMMDMREAQRSYEANLNVITATREMTRNTLELLRS